MKKIITILLACALVFDLAVSFLRGFTILVFVSMLFLITLLVLTFFESRGAR
jgi:hypothetical protein